MRYRVLSLFLLAVVLAVFVSAPAVADDKNTHEGKFVSARGTSFTMTDKDGKEHSHNLVQDAKVIGPDGKECKIEDFKKGQRIRVTTKEGDKQTAIKVEALKDD